MGTIDFDKFLASFITAMKECNRMRTFSIPVCIKKALEEQGLEYKDGEIVKSQRRVSAEAKENGYGESEDERIRKEIIAILQYKYENFSKDPKYCNAPQWIAWLENAKRQIEKQGEQNHSEKDLEMVVKPKFNIGDWIVSDLEDVNEDFRLCKIIGIEDGCYTIQSANGCNGYNFFEIWESDYHLWSIADAKEGDVLIDHCDDYKNPLIFILKKFERVDFGLAQKSDYSSYCFLTAGDKQRFKGGTYHHKHNIKPATKKQRDLLFQKMHEAGYTFDFEKKELKKLKFRVGDEVITENEKSLTITKIDEEGYWSNDLFICGFNTEHIWDLVEQKPIEWKQENREELTEFENAMMHIGGSFFGENAGLDPNDTATIREQAELLLELAPKTEWSEEDERNLRRAIRTTKVVYPVTADWLESIKQRHTWKPSDEQMEVLEWCRPLFIVPKLKGILESLINDLKKLKGE